MTIETKIAEIRQKIEEANTAYYIKNDPIMSDYDYDMLLRELKDLEEAHPEFKEDTSPTTRVNEDIDPDAIKAVHKERMYSLENIYNEEELETYIQSISKELGIPEEDLVFYCDAKYDGASLSIIYELTDDKTTYVFKQAISRGNGEVGEDLTDTIVKAVDFPERFSAENFPTKATTVTVRGECVVRTDAFEALNELRTAAGKKTYSSPRHAAAGLIRTKDLEVFVIPSKHSADPEELDLKFVKFASYGMDNTFTQNPYGLTTHTQMIDVLSECGLYTIERKVLKGLSGIKEALKFFEENRFLFKVEIDGVVFRLNRFEFQEKLGFTNKSPRFARAIKFQAARGSSVLKKIRIQVGRTGILTPVAIVDPPIVLGGVSISKVTLHNQDFIEELDIRIGDTITIVRSGDVIPKVVGVDHSKRNPNSKKYTFPTTCPICKNPVERKPDQVGVYCNNRECPARKLEQLAYVASRGCYDIRGLGEMTIVQLYLDKFVKDFVDFFKLEMDALILAGTGTKRAAKLLNVLETRKKTLSLVDHIKAFMIPGVGGVTAKVLAENFTSLRELEQATKEDFLKIPSIGETTADELVKYFAAHKWADRLESIGLSTMSKKKTHETKKTLVTGKTVRITGTLDIPRTAAYEELEIAGAIPAKSSSAPNILIVGENPSEQTLRRLEGISKIVHGKDFAHYVGPLP